MQSRIIRKKLHDGIGEKRSKIHRKNRKENVTGADAVACGRQRTRRTQATPEQTKAG